MTSPFPTSDTIEFSGPDWLKSRQKSAQSELENTALPATSEEIWRYSRVAAIDISKYSLVDSPSELEGELAARVDDVIKRFGTLSGSVVVVDGEVVSSDISDPFLSVKELSQLDSAPVAVTSLDDAFVVAADALSADGLLISVDENKAIDDLLLIVNVIATPSSLTFPRIAIEIGKNAKLTVVEVVISADIDALCIPVSEVRIDEDGALDHVVIQDAGKNVNIIARHSSELNRNSNLFLSNVVIGGSYARMRTDTSLIGEGSHSDLIAAYFGDGEQMHDFRTLQEHIAPHTTSDLFFRGAVAGSAHAVYSGLIRIRKGARGTDATQSNRTLKLSPNAVADSVPNLEIDENDVKCSHASAVGPVDDEQKYYLESRGIPAEEAERLVVLGTLDEVLARSRVVPVAEFTRALVRAKWEQKQ